MAAAAEGGPVRHQLEEGPWSCQVSMPQYRGCKAGRQEGVGGWMGGTLINRGREDGIVCFWKGNRERDNT